MEWSVPKRRNSLSGQSGLKKILTTPASACGSQAENLNCLMVCESQTMAFLFICLKPDCHEFPTRIKPAIFSQFKQ